MPCGWAQIADRHMFARAQTAPMETANVGGGRCPLCHSPSKESHMFDRNRSTGAGSASGDATRRASHVGATSLIKDGVYDNAGERLGEVEEGIDTRHAHGVRTVCRAVVRWVSRDWRTTLCDSLECGHARQRISAVRRECGPDEPHGRAGIRRRPLAATDAADPRPRQSIRARSAGSAGACVERRPPEPPARRFSGIAPAATQGSR